MGGEGREGYMVMMMVHLNLYISVDRESIEVYCSGGLVLIG